MTPTTLYLASRSPRRRELLTQLGLHPETLAVDIDETPLRGEAPMDYVHRMAIEKARAGLAMLTGHSTTPLVVMGADTSVVLGEQIFGKPSHQQHATEMLRSLSGRTHQVLSGVALSNGQREDCRVQKSQVRFRKLSEIEIQRYWATGEPVDKAGAYAIQGLGAVFIDELLGSYSGVMGLPLFETAELLADFAIQIL